MVVVTPKRIALLAALGFSIALALSAPSLITWQPGNRAVFWVLVVTATAAIWYGWLTYRLLRAQHTPVLVSAYEEGRTVIRNFGAGAALNVALANDDGKTITRVSDLPAAGTCTSSKPVDWTIHEARYLFYQDVFGRWYGTKCLGQGLGKAANVPVANVFLGRVFNPPSEARRGALVRSAVEHWVQLNRSWDPRNWVRRGRYWVDKWRAEKHIISLIRSAIVAGRLGRIFTPAEVSDVTELERVVADRFLPNHAVGNVGGEREFFVEDSPGRFRLK